VSGRRFEAGESDGAGSTYKVRSWRERCPSGTEQLDIGVADTEQPSATTKQRWALRAQLYLLGLVVAVPLLGLLAHALYSAARNELQHARAQALSLAQVTANHIRDYLDDSQNLLARLAERPGVRALDRLECESALIGALELHREVTNFVSFNRAGELVCSVIPHAKSADAREAALLRRVVREDKFAIDGPRIDPATGKWVSMQAYPLHDDGGRPAGVIGLFVDLASYEQASGSAAPPLGTTYAILDEKGTVVTFSPQPKNWVGRNVRETGWANIALDGPQGQGQGTGADGIDRVYGFSAVPDTNWTAVAGIPAEIVFAPVRKAVIDNMLSALAIALAVAVVAWALSRRITQPIREIARAASAVEQGRLDTRVRVQGPREIAEVATQFNRMLEAREQADAALRDSTQRLQTLSRRLLDIQESERRHIARELHDEIGQALTSMKLRLQAVQRLPAAASGSPHLEECIRIAERTLEQVRNLSRELRPPLLDDLGLVPALRWYLGQQAQATGLLTRLEANGLPPRLGAELEIACFRIVQEAVSNAARHAHGRNVWVELAASGEMLNIRVRDDGVGFDPAAARERARTGASMGLLSMEERAVFAGGRIELRSAPAHGTEVRASFPLTRAVTRDDRAVEEVSQ
jgi:signal transduction histidine kinase